MIIAVFPLPRFFDKKTAGAACGWGKSNVNAVAPAGRPAGKTPHKIARCPDSRGEA
jgi:hypothetical protein